MSEERLKQAIRKHLEKAPTFEMVWHNAWTFENWVIELQGIIDNS